MKKILIALVLLSTDFFVNNSYANQIYLPPKEIICQHITAPDSITCTDFNHHYLIEPSTHNHRLPYNTAFTFEFDSGDAGLTPDPSEPNPSDFPGSAPRYTYKNSALNAQVQLTGTYYEKADITNPNWVADPESGLYICKNPTCPITNLPY